MSDRIERLTSDNQAWNVGYEEGASLRKHGALPENLHATREIMHEQALDHRAYRGPQVLFYASWRLGFDAGYLGKPKVCPSF